MTAAHWLWLPMILATSIAPSQPGTLMDVPYVAGGGHRQQLDLYLPAGTGFPVVLYVHEGSLTSGDRKDADYPRLARAFRDHGYGVAVMSYRLFPQHRWPAPAADVASAFAWLRANAASFGGRPDRIFLVGHSSGATLVARISSDGRHLARVGLAPRDIAGAVVMGTILRDQELEEALERATRSGRRARLDSLFRVDPDYSMYDGVEAYVDSWPLHHVNAEMPPMLITVAETERHQPPCLPHAEAFRDSANRMGGHVEVAVLPGRDHYSAMRKLSEPNDPVFARLDAFLRGVSSPNPRAKTMPGVGTPPSALKLDRFYTKHVDAEGLPIVSSGRVPDKALVAAAELVGHMLAGRPDIRRTLIEGRVHLAVMARDEVTTDIPEHSQLKPKEYWDQRARGLGGTPYIPTTSCAEENLLGYEDDRYCGENILIHEFSHTVHEVGMRALDPVFDGRLQELYERAMARGLWKGTYAATNHKEYWAEGVQSYFDANLRADPPDGVHNHVRTRELLREYDPALAGFIDQAFRRNPWRWSPGGAHQRRWNKHLRWPKDSR